MAAYRRGTVSRARRAAERYLRGGTTLQREADRQGICTSAVHSAVVRMREEQRDIWPEDEVTL